MSRCKFIGIEERRKNKTSFAIAASVVWAPLPIKKRVFTSWLKCTKCLKSKIPAIGISDFGNLFGSMEFSLECKASGIQPIIGCNIYLVDNNFENGYLLLIAKNELGFKNLSRLVTISYLENSKENYPYVWSVEIKGNSFEKNTNSILFSWTL